MLLPVVPGLDLADVIPLSKEIEQDIIEPTIAPAAQLATAISSKDPIATKRGQGKQLPMQSAKLNKLTYTSLSDPKPANIQTIHDCTFEDEDRIFIKQLVLIPIITNNILTMKCMQSCPISNMSMTGIKILTRDVLLISLPPQKILVFQNIIKANKSQCDLPNQIS